MNNKLVFAFPIDRADCAKVTMHKHTCHELVFYAEKSKGIGQFGDRTYRFSDGGVAIIEKGCMHEETHYSAGKVMCLGIETDHEIRSLYCANLFALENLFAQILQEVREQEFGFENLIACKIEEILIHIFRKTETHPNEMKDLAHCKAYMNENYAQDISIADVAAMIGYSPDHFRHLFKKAYGISPQGFLIEKRLSVAFNSLKTTNLNCARVAEISGFSNSSQLTRMMKEKYGKTPTQIRAEADKTVIQTL